MSRNQVWLKLFNPSQSFCYVWRDTYHLVSLPRGKDKMGIRRSGAQRRGSRVILSVIDSISY